MCQLSKDVAALSRPATLVKAAAAGQPTYHRRRDLRRMLRAAIPATPRAALEALLPIEAALERRRRDGDTKYSITRHVDILIALMAEGRALRA